jgi:hypothetical protein
LGLVCPKKIILYNRQTIRSVYVENTLSLGGGGGDMKGGRKKGGNEKENGKRRQIKRR